MVRPVRRETDRTHANGFLVAVCASAVLVACSDGRVVTDARGPEVTTPSFFAAEGGWTAPVNMGAPLNTPALENAPELSRDGLALYFASNRPGGVGSVDIYVSRRACADASDPLCGWGEPMNLGPTVNTTALDGGPHLSRDGHWLYLFSDRPGGFGSNDIYVLWRADVHDDLAWSAPVNLGPPINTDQLEAGPNLRGQDFYFHRGRTGDTDIYLSHRSGAGFTEPVRVDEVSAQPSIEQRPSTRWDGREMILSSDRPGTLGLQDIWMSSRRGNGQPWGEPVNLGALINTPFQEQTPTITDDGMILLFASNRVANNTDLYISYRTGG